jgi:hypothetical protein
MAGKKKADVCGDGIDTGKFDPALDGKNSQDEPAQALTKLLQFLSDGLRNCSYR